MRIWKLGKQLDEVGLNKVRLKAKLDENRIDLSKILLDVIPCQNNRNLVKILILTESEQGLSKIWTEVVTLTVRNCTRIDMGSRSDEIWSIKLIKSILTVVKEMKRFSNREIIFLINVIFKKWRTVLFIKFEIQNVIDISSLIIILSNNGFSRFLLLIRQEVSDYMI